MDQFTKHLIELSDSLDKANNIKCANMVDKLIESKSVTKISQYVGVIGYVHNQNRAMGNCIRKKRVANSGSMQEVVLDCLKEYQDGQSYNNNEWTSKYAQVIQQYPEKFESFYKDYINVIASENNMQIHIDNVKNTASLLKENGINDKMFDAVTKDIDSLNKWEGDVSHRPFKVAAPPSPRSKWSRMWPGNWGKRGKDKDTKFEMSQVLEGISDISRSGQQIKQYINNLKQRSPNLANNDLAGYIKQLSPDNWQQIIYINSFLNENLENEPDLLLVEDSVRGIDSSINSINQSLGSIRDVMRDLRLRDAMKGTSRQYAELEKTLNKLAQNPLDEQSLYYSQIVHGRLEEALNNMNLESDENYNEWSASQVSEQEISPINSDVSGADTTIGPTGNAVQDTANQINSLLGTDLSLVLSDLLEEMVFDSSKGGLDPVKGQNLTQLLSALRKNKSTSSDPPFAYPVQPEPVRLAPESFNKYKIIKICDIIDTVSPELADLLDEYLEKELKESSFPEFPSSSSPLKEEILTK